MPKEPTTPVEARAAANRLAEERRLAVSRERSYDRPVDTRDE
jgi:hypothetical protein